jgi:hypothetical protein
MRGERKYCGCSSGARGDLEGDGFCERAMYSTWIPSPRTMASNASILRYGGDGKECSTVVIEFDFGSAIADQAEIEGEEREGGWK